MVLICKTKKVKESCRSFGGLFPGGEKRRKYALMRTIGSTAFLLDSNLNKWFYFYQNIYTIETKVK